MSLLDELSAEADAMTVSRCPVRKWLSSLPADIRPDVDEVVTSRYPAPTILAFLRRKFGEVPFDDKGLGAHRRRLAGREGCRCPVS